MIKKIKIKQKFLLCLLRMTQAFDFIFLFGNDEKPLATLNFITEINMTKKKKSFNI